MKTRTLQLRNSLNRSPLRAFLLIPLLLLCFALSPIAQAVSPAPDGGYTGWNTAEGQDALFSNSTGSFNTAIGGDALFANTTGSANTAVGAFSLTANSSGFQNAAIGQGALRFNTTGLNNTASGFQALYSNTTGAANTASGIKALFKNTFGNANTATGAGALQSNTTGSNNTATGISALFSNTTGSGNTANGLTAVFSNTTGLNNTANGNSALFNNTTGSSNIALGTFAGGNLTTGSNNVDIYDAGVAGESNTIRIGTEGTQTNTYVAGISGVTVAGGVGVIVDNSGHLGTSTSSARYKENMQPMDKASEAILALKPVTFRYKKDLDPKGIPQFGLVAEDVEKVNPDLVARDEQGKPYTVRYEAVNAMLLNEFLKEHKKVQQQAREIQEQRATISELRNEMGTVIARLEEQDSKIQKVSDEVELSKAVPVVVRNDP